MTLRRRTFWCLRIGFLATLAFCKRQPGAAKESDVEKPRIIDIIPGRSIGEVRLGMKVDELPSRAVINRPAGALDDIRLLINEAGEVDDIWIEDVRTFPHKLRFQGKAIPPDARVESLQPILGKCEQIAGIKGGTFYNCAVGLALGTDFAKQTLQLRVKPISTK
jgi:hypothetical protein